MEPLWSEDWGQKRSDEKDRVMDLLLTYTPHTPSPPQFIFLNKTLFMRIAILCTVLYNVCVRQRVNHGCTVGIHTHTHAHVNM